MPLDHLLDPRDHQRNTNIQNGIARTYAAIAYGPHCIWGATAAMILNLADFLGGGCAS